MRLKEVAENMSPWGIDTQDPGFKALCLALDAAAACLYVMLGAFRCTSVGMKKLGLSHLPACLHCVNVESLK